ncbi:MAG TPA: hypothetical protein VFW47_02215 [Phenylobacterium sp.]|nr:hypothetical protein [Phenylobacterium sp.]
MEKDSQRSDPPDRRRQTARLGAEFLLNTARLVARAIDRDMLTALILLAITRANMRDLAVDREASQPFAALDTIAPDSLRRPISVYAVARELRLPYESVRRHAAKLKAEGLCESVGRGVIIPGRVFANASWMEATQENFESAVVLVNDAATFGIVAPGPEGTAEPDVRRRVVWLTVDFFLSALTLTGQPAGLDAMSVLVLRAIGLANVEHLARSRELGAAFGGLTDIPRDEDRKPVSVYAIAKFLELPYETARRITLRLVALGFVERRAEGGLVVPSTVLGRPEVIAGFIEFAQIVELFLQRLALAGVTPTRVRAKAVRSPALRARMKASPT